MAVEAQTIRVLIADDQTLFRSGLARLLAEDPRITICGQAVDGDAIGSGREQLMAFGLERGGSRGRGARRGRRGRHATGA